MSKQHRPTVMCQYDSTK